MIKPSAAARVPPIDLHPAFGALDGDEPAATVDLMSIPGGKKETLYAENRKVLNDALHQPGAQPPSSMMLINEHLTNPCEGGIVSDNTREGRLLILGVYGVRTRPGD